MSRWAGWQALPDRAASALCVSGGLPGADADRRSAGNGGAARRQEQRLRLYHICWCWCITCSRTSGLRGPSRDGCRHGGVWLANFLFAAAGLFLLSQMATGGACCGRFDDAVWFGTRRISDWRRRKRTRKQRSRGAERPCPAGSGAGWQAELRGAIAAISGPIWRGRCIASSRAGFR
jgi:hypothetical protein